MLITNVTVYTMNEKDEIIKNGYIFVENGKIKDVGTMENLPDVKTEVKDMKGMTVYPGFIDAHTHLGIFGDSVGIEDTDGNEDSDPITPQLNVIDAVNLKNRYFAEALDGGVTTVLISPGSTNPIAGQIAAVKTYDGIKREPRIDNMIVKSPAAIKFSLGENPKCTYNDKDQMPVTRMAVAALIREMLEKAKRYERQKRLYEKDSKNYDEPEYDQKCEALLPLIRREIPAHFHAHTSSDIYTALRISKEYNIRPVIVHATEGHEMCGDLIEETEGVLSGPIITDRSKPELRNHTASSAAIMSSHGVMTALITDHPEIPINYLIVCAATAVRNGMDRYSAVKAITINPAKICGISDRVGSIEIGKDADMVMYNGDPLDITNIPAAKMINGLLIE